MRPFGIKSEVNQYDDDTKFSFSFSAEMSDGGKAKQTPEVGHGLCKTSVNHQTWKIGSTCFGLAAHICSLKVLLNLVLSLDVQVF